MNTIINGPVRDALAEGAASTLLNFGGALAIMLALVLLLVKEAVRVRSGPRAQAWLEALDIAVIPLLGAAGLVILRHIFTVIGR